jgi:DNA recombination protein RmuC
MEPLGVFLVAACGLAVMVAVAALVSGRRGPDPSTLQTLDVVSRLLGRLQGDLSRLAGAQDELRHELQRGREASVRELAAAAQGIHSELGSAHRALAEVKALEQGRARRLDEAADSLKRLEAVVAGSGTRGAAGENILARALAQLPPDLFAVNVAFGNKVVEFALRLPGGRFLPIDSKWTSVGPLERLPDAEPQERQRLAEQVTRELRGRIREMTKYLDPERTLGLGVLAVPDAAYEAAAEVHGDAYREGVLVAPYSLALPYVLALYRLTVRFGAAVDTDQLAARLRALGETLRRIDEEIEGRLSRGLVQLENSREALRDHVAEAQRGAERLLRSAEADHSVEPREAVPDPAPELTA